MGVHFSRAIQDVKNDKSCRVLILTGEGDCFSAGGDFKFLEQRCQDTPANNRTAMKSFYDAFLSIRELSIPVIAAVQGHAIGAGLALALATDLRFVSQDAKLGLTFVGLGLHPGMGATFFTALAAGQQRARWALLTGDRFTGAQACDWGMFLDALPQAEVLEHAIVLAQKISQQSRQAVQTTLKTLREYDEAALQAALWKEAVGQSLCYGHPEMEEGLTAIQEKRKPSFQ
jgi:enoyl-CoA hydratase